MINTALLVIEVQNDFMDNGSLPAKDTASLVQPLNHLLKWVESNDLKCIFTRAWHPANHCSFVNYGGIWPPHCVQGTKGAEFASGVRVPNFSTIIDIETEPQDNNPRCSAFENTDLERILKEANIHSLAVCGIATDYSVKTTVFDALKLKFDVTVLTDLVRPIDVAPGDSAIALSEMLAGGAALMTSSQFVNYSNNESH